MKKIFSAVLTLQALLAIPAVADIYIRQISHTEAFSMMGQEQPARDDTIHMWMGTDKMAVEMPQMKVVIDLAENVMYWISHQDKSYVEMALPLDIDQYFPAQMTQLMKNVKVTVTPTDEKQKIGEWDCQAYEMVMNIMMMDMKQKIWASTDVPFDWKEYSIKMLPKVSQATMGLPEEAVQEMTKIQGFQIKTETIMDVPGNEMKSWQEVQEITKKTAPDGTYTPPAGYSKKDKLDMMDIQRR